MNVFESDQFAAATRDARARIHRAAQSLQPGAQFEERGAGRFADGLVARLTERLDNGTQQLCEHLTAPGIAWLLSWDQTRLACDACALESAAHHLGPEAPQKCDICGCTDRALGSIPAAAGPVMVLIATCRPCYDAELGVAS